MSEIVPQSVEIGDSVLYQTVGDEVVLLNMSTQQYFGLDGVATDVWQLLIEHKDIAVVTQRLTAMYSVDENTARADVQALISDLLAADLIKTADGRAV